MEYMEGPGQDISWHVWNKEMAPEEKYLDQYHRPLYG